MAWSMCYRQSEEGHIVGRDKDREGTLWVEDHEFIEPEFSLQPCQSLGSLNLVLHTKTGDNNILLKFELRIK